MQVYSGTPCSLRLHCDLACGASVIRSRSAFFTSFRQRVIDRIVVVVAADCTLVIRCVYLEPYTSRISAENKTNPFSVK